ncbi:hypothetical protein GUY44_21255 [Pimelobacter simplex]|uniref:Uncharacterized protein n=1 Tax=Nocardioides simplex TaxID=2045 RepID=A0A0A1DI63_NOCSI|nr:hypothetical protein [Pimelobacter simplex]AIY16332.1 hypothetical protein KR76_05390 [Pimelobacter simplex]MCG8153025.1 hypothetical protein [Pimelobacter simplex]GEB11992.1 hypothetical protein NSI01_03070 [Pimelobacter simplex]SFN04183.1 hypothetical protein SAMN05421671_4852 [Pimelobacter simplex]
MTDTELTELITRTCAGIDPASAVQDRILGDALADGRRQRRRRRRLAATGWSTAAVVLTVAGVTAAAGLLAGSGPGEGGREVAVEPTTRAASPTPTAAPSYAPGTGPTVATSRRVVADGVLAGVTRDLVPDDIALTGLEVEHVPSLVTGHESDHTRNGRRISFLLDGAGTSITVARWDSYAAVGVAGLGDGLTPGEEPREQRVATTAREACAGAYSVYPPTRCTEVAGGWYSAGRPSQGAAMPDTHQELLVTYFTDDGYAVIVDSYNTPAEKSGGVVAPEPLLDEAQALAIATSPRWFRDR